jgi:hypothetical protein
MDLSAQTLTNISGLQTSALVANGVYEIEAVIGMQTTGTQGCQWAVQSSSGAGTLEAQISAHKRPVPLPVFND